MWITLFFKYPKTSIEAFLCNSYGYYYPESIHWVVGREVVKSDLDTFKSLDMESDSLVNLRIVEKVDSFIDRRNLAINSMLFSIGFNFWIVLSMFTYTLYKKKYKLSIIYIPILVLWLTCLASPVYGEFRYIYSMFTCMPILIGIHFIDNKNSLHRKK